MPGAPPGSNFAPRSSALEASTIAVPPKPMVEIAGVSKYFLSRAVDSAGEPQRFTALSSVNATIGRGELVTLLGPSGCGKTTLLRIAAGLTMADEGSITIDGSLVAAPRKDACFVFQHVGLLPWRTVHANIEFPLELDGVSKRERAERARAARLRWPGKIW